MGIPLTDIIDFFKDPNVYHKVLARFGSIEPYMRYRGMRLVTIVTIWSLRQLHNFTKNRNLYIHVLSLKNTAVAEGEEGEVINSL